ncbi:hypothetical protein E2C01_047678 [Portunus trituberculatus]|uniref:Uncharacterized protein n=1 Tax=Portunus trituberculatus TaxID=210409 RepID=A0A5B7G9I1_PORTR|nr:hypothetical protein [Portunus trituberculatus]
MTLDPRPLVPLSPPPPPTSAAMTDPRPGPPPVSPPPSRPPPPTLPVSSLAAASALSMVPRSSAFTAVFPPLSRSALPDLTALNLAALESYLALTGLSRLAGPRPSNSAASNSKKFDFSRLAESVAEGEKLAAGSSSPPVSSTPVSAAAAAAVASLTQTLHQELQPAHPRAHTYGRAALHLRHLRQGLSSPGPPARPPVSDPRSDDRLAATADNALLLMVPLGADTSLWAHSIE